MSDFEEHNMGAYIAALKTRVEKAERERDEYRSKAALYHADMMKVRAQRDDARRVALEEAAEAVRDLDFDAFEAVNDLLDATKQT